MNKEYNNVSINNIKLIYVSVFKHHHKIAGFDWSDLDTDVLYISLTAPDYLDIKFRTVDVPIWITNK